MKQQRARSQSNRAFGATSSPTSEEKSHGVLLLQELDDDEALQKECEARLRRAKRPIAQPDADNSACHSCEAPFSIAVRRHHCRSCGLIFCRRCSKWCRQLPLLSYGDHPVRVCEPCFYKSDQELYLEIAHRLKKHCSENPLDAHTAAALLRRLFYIAQSSFPLSPSRSVTSPNFTASLSEGPASLSPSASADSSPFLSPLCSPLSYTSQEIFPEHLRMREDELEKRERERKAESSDSDRISPSSSLSSSLSPSASPAPSPSSSRPNYRRHTDILITHRPQEIDVMLEQEREKTSICSLSLWDVEDVTEWVRTLRLGRETEEYYRAEFQAREIDGTALMMLDRAKLERDPRLSFIRSVDYDVILAGIVKQRRRISCAGMHPPIAIGQTMS